MQSETAFGRAGGGGGSRSGSSSYSGSRSNRNSLGEFFIHVIGFASMAGCALALRAAHRKIDKKNAASLEALQFMANTEPEWAAYRLTELVNEKFIVMQKAWSDCDLNTIEAHTTQNLYLTWAAELQKQTSESKRNIIRNLVIEKTRFVAVVNRHGKDKDFFTVCFTASAVDVYISLSEIEANPDLLSQNSQSEKFNVKPERFSEFWTFERHGEDWKLAKVSQMTLWRKFVDSEIVFERYAPIKGQVLDVAGFSGTNEQTAYFSVLVGCIAILSLMIVFITEIILKPLFLSEMFFTGFLAAIPLMFFLFLVTRQKLKAAAEHNNVSFQLSFFTKLIYFSSVPVTSYALILLLNLIPSPLPEKVYSGIIIDKTYKKPSSYYAFVQIEKDEDGQGFEKPLRFAVDEQAYYRIMLGESRLDASIERSLMGIRRLRQTELSMLGEARKPEQRNHQRGKREVSKSSKKFDEQTFAAKSAAIDWNPEPIRTQPDSYKITHWSSGKIKAKEPVINGKINGIGLYWFENGREYGEIPYVDGKKHGRFTLYREDGSLDQRLSYKNGQLHGLCVWYNQTGTKETQAAVYADGELLFSKKYSPE